MKVHGREYTELDERGKFQLFMENHAGSLANWSVIYDVLAENLNVKRIAELVRDKNTIVGFKQKEELDREILGMVEREVVKAVEYAMDKLVDDMEMAE